MVECYLSPPDYILQWIPLCRQGIVSCLYLVFFIYFNPVEMRHDMLVRISSYGTVDAHKLWIEALDATLFLQLADGCHPWLFVVFNESSGEG